MCGISGEFRFDGGVADMAAVSAMCDELQRRGPDGSGGWQDGPVALGHRRLKIIDLTDAGAQPMVDAELGLTMVFNGSSTTTRSSAPSCRGHGYRFFSTSDTEVDAQGLPPLGARLRRALLRDVRLRGRRAGHRPGGPGPRPAGHQAALPRRRRPGPGAVRLLAAGAGAGRRRRHQHRPGRAAPLHVLPRRRPGTADDPVRGRQAAAGHRAHHRTRRPRSPTGTYWRPVHAAAARARRPAPRSTGRSWCSRRCGPRSSGGWSPTSRSGCCCPAAWTPASSSALLAEEGQHGLHDLLASASRRWASGRATSSSTPTSSPKKFDTDHHQLLMPIADGARRPGRRDRGDERADGQPRLRRVLPALPAGVQHVKVVQSGQGADEVLAGYDWYPPLDGVPPSRRRRRLRRASSSTGRTRELAGILQPAVDDDRGRQPGFRRRPLRPAGRGHRAGPGAAAGLADHAGRRPGQAGGQHDDGLGPGGPGAVPGPRVRRAGRRRPAGAEAAARRQGRAEGGRPQGAARRGDRPAEGLLPGAGDHRPGGRVPGDGCATRCTHRRPGSAACSGPDTSSGCWPSPNTHRTTLGSNQLWQIGLLELWLQRHGIR